MKHMRVNNKNIWNGIKHPCQYPGKLRVILIFSPPYLLSSPIGHQV